MTDYISLPDMKNSLELENLTFADNDIRDSIAAASSAIEQQCGRVFSSGGTTEVRYFTAYATDPCVVEVDDLLSGTVVTDYDGDGVYETSWVVGTDYLLEPANAPAINMPYTSLRGRYAYSTNRFPLAANGIKITGQFGFASPPPEIVVATKIVAIRFLRRVRDAPFGVITFATDATMAQITATDPDLRFLLEGYISSHKVMAA